MLPIWSDTVGPISWSGGPIIFNTDNAAVYAQSLIVNLLIVRPKPTSVQNAA
jgi:hypothetical protein